VVLTPMAGLRIVPAARALAHARNIDQWLAALAGELSPHPDLIVLHQSMPLATFSGDWLVAASPLAETLTRTYSELKRMPRAADGAERGRLRLLVGRAADEHSARTLHRALDEASQRFLDASIDWAGYVPHDASLRRAEAAARPVFDIDLQAASALALMDTVRAIESWDLPRVQPSRTAL
jgi:flagellar biosynthesis protein FlhG